MSDLVLYPARVVGTDIVHLAETKKDVGELLPQLRAVCPVAGAQPIQLELIPEGARTVWCGPCKDYALELGAARFWGLD